MLNSIFNIPSLILSLNISHFFNVVGYVTQKIILERQKYLMIAFYYQEIFLKKLILDTTVLWVFFYSMFNVKFSKATNEPGQKV